MMSCSQPSCVLYSGSMLALLTRLWKRIRGRRIEPWPEFVLHYGIPITTSDRIPKGQVQLRDGEGRVLMKWDLHEGRKQEGVKVDLRVGPRIDGKKIAQAVTDEMRRR